MKYCTKCGNELLDEAVVCPRCGCEVEKSSDPAEKMMRSNKRSKLAAASALNVVAFALGMVFCVLVALQSISVLEEPTPRPDNTTTYQVDFFSSIVMDRPILSGVETPTDKQVEWAKAEVERWEQLRATKRGMMIWGVLIVLVFAVGIVTRAMIARKNQKWWAYLYLVTAIVTLLWGLLANLRNIVVFLVCGLAPLLFVPIILQSISCVKFMQAASIHE